MSLNPYDLITTNPLVTAENILYSGSGYSVPIALSINEVSRDKNNYLIDIDNSPTFNSDPTFNFVLTPSDNALISPSQSTSLFSDRLVTSAEPFSQGISSFLYNPITSRQNIGLPNFYLESRLSQYNFDPYIQLLDGVNIFENSIYYATPNNYNANRPNPYRYVVENQFGINTTSNLQQIASGSAQKAQVPQSNYTAKKVTIPRYSGSKVTSADYNTYAASGSNVEFANGETGSWGGDSSYGKTSAIDKYPRYIAHFEQSINNFTKAGTYTFNVDKLIEIPQKDITQDSLTVNPVTVKIDGSNKNLLATTNTFEKGRKATIAYGTKQIESPAVTFTKTNADGSNPTSVTRSLVVDYSSLKIGNSEIFQGGMEYQTVYSTQRTLRNYTISSSFQTSQNCVIVNYNDGSQTTIAGEEAIGNLTQSHNIQVGGAYPFGEDYWASTGSGYLQLEGPPTKISMSLGINANVSFGTPPTFPQQTYYGGFLSILHTWNYWVKNQTINGYPLTNTGVTPSNGAYLWEKPGLQYDGSNTSIELVRPNEPDNYFRFNTSASQAGASLRGYEDFDLNFLAERGDEIRVTYNINNDSSVKTLITQDFQVLDVINHSESFVRHDSTKSEMNFLWDNGGVLTKSPVSGSNLYDRIAVTPDPSTLDIPIPNGEIYQFTIRKRVNADDRVMVFQTPPFKSYGAQTKTGDGYLIPEDLSEAQKNNVQTIINQLQQQNAVPPSSKDTGGGGGFTSS
tara:strand:- start:568 stop:2781 length:2214 start_codon:yes stop_codon:yes gene_type:complete